jgi:putative addiction module CopG family antidote
MNITLTPELESIVREGVESGRYTNGSEVVYEALRLLERRDKEERLRTALGVGIEAADRGDVVEWTPQLMEEIWLEARAAIEAGEQPDPDVCP